MKAKLMVAGLLFLSGCGTYAAAGTKDHSTAKLHQADTQVISVSINKDGDGPATVELKVNGKHYNFSLPQLAEGESREITTDDGKTITLVKAAQGSSVVIDGKTIRINALGNAEHMAQVFAFSNKPDDKSITINAVGLSDNQKAQIKAAIEATGIERKVRFGGGFHWFSTDGDSKQDIEIIVNGDKDGADGKPVHLIKRRIEIRTQRDGDDDS